MTTKETRTDEHERNHVIMRPPHVVYTTRGASAVIIHRDELFELCRSNLSR